MTTTNIRSKGKKKPSPKAKADGGKLGILIQLEDIRIGDEIVTSWHEGFPPGMSEERQEELAIRAFEMGETVRFVNRTKRVEKIEECAGKWRTHVHINKSDCYDMRQKIWVVE
jgi:hypothetical protein